MVFWQMVDALGWMTEAVMVGGTAWASYYLVSDSRARRRSRREYAAAWSDRSLRDRLV